MLRLSPLALPLAILTMISCQFVSTQETGNYPIHLVIDAGSSGTRFCPFPVQSGSCSPVETDVCFSVAAPGGMADLKEDEIQALMGEAFAQLDGLEIKRAVLLGTGGFRRLNSVQQRQQIQIAGNSLAAQFALSEARILSGEEEARLAYLAVSLERDGKRDHVILETGGATVQLAGTEVKPRSIPAGLNAFREMSGPPEPCMDEVVPAPDRFDKCTSELLKIMKKEPWAAAFFVDLAAKEVFALGSAWKSIFAIADDSQLETARLLIQGQKVCNSTNNDIVNMGVPEKFAGRSCYLHSFQYALLMGLNVQEVRAADTGWAPGAAMDPAFFPNCPR